MNRLQKIIIIITAIFFAKVAYPCSCIGLKKITEENYQNAGEIFIGEIIAIKELESTYEKLLTFKVKRSLKNDDITRTIVVKTALDAAACGLDAEIGFRYYVFAHYDDDGILYAGLCGRSVHLNKKFDKRRIFFYGIKHAILEKRSYKKNLKRFRSEKRFIRKIKNAP